MRLPTRCARGPQPVRPLPSVRQHQWRLINIAILCVPRFVAGAALAPQARGLSGFARCLSLAPHAFVTHPYRIPNAFLTHS